MKLDLLLRNSLCPVCCSLILLVFTSCASPNHFKEWNLSPSLEEQIDVLCIEQSEVGHLPGLVIAIVGKHQQIWTKSYGYADILSKEPINPGEHLFRVGSISKTVTAAALARLCEDKELAVDTSISKYYPKIPADKSALTLRLLGGHLGGIRHYNGLEFMSNEHYDDVFGPLDVFIDDTLLCVPGTAYNYSTYGWTLLSAVMESGTGDSFLEIIKEEVSKPLQLSDLKADHIDSTHFSRVSFYTFENNIHLMAPDVDVSNKWAGGGFLCSAEDMAKFGYALVQPGYLNRHSLEVFTMSQSTDSGELTNYGIGFRTGMDEQGRKWIGHSGGSIGGTSMLLIFPDHNLVVVTLVNMGNASMNQLAQKIADLILSQTD